MSVRPGELVALGALLVSPSLALAQTAYSGQPVDIYSGVVTAPANILAQGGATIGVAEGVAGIKFNPASVANRFAYGGHEYWEWDWNVDFTISGVAELGDTDVFNSGRSNLDVDQLSTTNLGVDFQFGRLGVGVTFSDTAITECDAGTAACLSLGREDEGTTTTVRTARIAAGYAFLDGDFLVGASAFVPSIVFDINGDDSASPNVSGGTLEFGVLWRPGGENFRLGATLRPRSSSNLDVDSAEEVIAGRRVPEQLVSPWIIGVGGAYAFGTRPMNLRPTFGDESRVGDRYGSFARGHYQVSADLILIGSNPSTVGLDGWFAQEAQATGRSAALAAHLGLEGEVIADLMIVRLGSYFEPSRFAETEGRLHGTGGLDFRLFKLIWVWRVGVAFDVSRDFDQVTFSAGFWH